MSNSDLFENVKAYLVDSGLKPGDTIESEVDLAKRFGVSRHQIRNVLGSMVQAGIIERTRRRGTVIRDFDTGVLSNNIRFHFEVAQFDIAEFKEARILVERAILPLAVKRITASHLVKIEWAIEQMRKYRDEPEKADAFDKEFHLLLFQACGNDVLQAFSGVLTTLFRSADYRRKYWTSDRIAQIADEHSRIVEAIRRGDAAEAVAAMDRHLGYAKLNLPT